MLLKSDGRHSHLYVGTDGETEETSIAQTGVAHEHDTEFGPTGGAVSDPDEKALPTEEAHKAKDQSGIVGGVAKNSR